MRTYHLSLFKTCPLHAKSSFCCTFLFSLFRFSFLRLSFFRVLTLLIFLALLSTYLFTPKNFAYAQPVNQADSLYQQALAIEARTQKAQDAWTEEQERMIEEIRTMKIEIQWLEMQEKKYERYTQAQKEQIETLNADKAAYERIALELEEALVGDVEQLKAFISNDIPFLEEERAKRIQFLETTLQNPELGIGEKLRRVLEALEIESAYNQSIDYAFQELEVSPSVMRLAHVVRIGRTSYFYVTQDGNYAGLWEPATRTFAPLFDPDYAKNLLEIAQSLAEQKKFTQLFVLPVKEIR